MCVMSLDFEKKRYRKHFHGDDIQDALSPSTAMVFFYLFPMKQ